MSERHVTLTLEEADELAEYLERHFNDDQNTARATQRALHIVQSLRQRWLDALRKESA